MKLQKTHYCLRQEAGTEVFKLYIYDDIKEYGTFDWWTWEYEESETSAEHYRKVLAEIPESATIELHINSYGGDVKEGIAIYSQLKQKKCKEIVAYVDGVAYSVASVILQAADRRIMGLGTTLLIHNVWTQAAGNAKELRKIADDLDVIMQSNRQIYLERVNITEEELIEMLENETYLTPEDAVKKGFADEVSKKEEAAPDVEKLQQQLRQMRREMAAQKTFREEMKEFFRSAMQKKDADSEDEDGDSSAEDDETGEEDSEDESESGEDSTEADDTEEDDTEEDDTGEGDTEDDEKKQQSGKKKNLAAMLGAAAAQFWEER